MKKEKEIKEIEIKKIISTTYKKKHRDYYLRHKERLNKNRVLSRKLKKE